MKFLKFPLNTQRLIMENFSLDLSARALHLKLQMMSRLLFQILMNNTMKQIMLELETRFIY
jgi:hypothetical protein